MIPWVSDDDVQWIDEELLDCFENSDLTTSVTYQSVSATSAGYAFNATTGVFTVTSTDVSCHAILGELFEDEAGRHPTGRWIVLLRADELGSVTPAVKDRIVHGSVIYEVEEADRAMLGKVWRLRVRKH